MNIGGKQFMNLQEAVGWLLQNNALPFQSTANYVANTEIAMSTLINPSPAKVRVGSLIFFADSKVSTVVGVTSNSFIVSDQYNDLVDDIAYVTGVSINASGHLIITLSDGQTIDAGIIKQVSNFSINASQHLIANYNDGTSTDLGAIFSGNITISGNLSVSGGISGNAITGNSIIENMAGYSYVSNGASNITEAYAGVVKNGNKLTLVLAGTLTKGSDTTTYVGYFIIPQAVMDVLIPISGEYLATDNVNLKTSVFSTGIAKSYGIAQYYTRLVIRIFGLNVDLSDDGVYMFRIEQTFLLSSNLLP